MMLEFDCPTSRSVVYYIEAILPLALYGKKDLTIKLKGITNDEIDVSVETVRCVWIPMLKFFSIDDTLDLKIVKRGFNTGGGKYL
jgi:RNA 3'-terminal phosphate cyclase-like protein